MKLGLFFTDKKLQNHTKIFVVFDLLLLTLCTNFIFYVYYLAVVVVRAAAALTPEKTAK